MNNIIPEISDEEFENDEDLQELNTKTTTELLYLMQLVQIVLTRREHSPTP